MDKESRSNKETQQGFSQTVISPIESQVQKTVTAVYMVSDLINPSDPIRKNLRSLSVRTLALVQEIQVQSSSKAQETITKAQKCVSSLIELLKVSVSVGFISDMNYTILTKSLLGTQDNLHSKYTHLLQMSHASKGFHNRAVEEFVLPDSLFSDKETPQSYRTEGKSDMSDKKTTGYKDMSFKKDMSDKVVFKPGSVSKAPKHKTQAKSSNREDSVLGFVQQKGEVSVSDVSQEYAEVSEKTIQRLLVKLVEKGKLKKKGEKRWSRYYI